MISTNQRFYGEVVEGLSATPKYLQSKYFYDKNGDDLFQRIMRCPEYYLTRCEEEIFSLQSHDIAGSVKSYLKDFEVIGLGAGDGSKSAYLLKEFLNQKLADTYYPVDISANIIQLLEENIPKDIVGLKVKGFHGEYIEMLRNIRQFSNKRKIIFFLGSNVGNYRPDQAIRFCCEMHECMNAGDLLLIGFDLKKNPQVILDAYSDKQGLTKDFNLNLLTRINRELGGNFKLGNFDHYAMYDPVSGACKSFLVSLKNQQVKMGSDFSADFSPNEIIQMEISQKYSIEAIDVLAERSGFKVLGKFYDSKKWFTDCLWQKV
ncbi:MAG: L-histidine N(alpha)-methyltransferase [Chitinophagaceae bacterium]|nr:MAG: L-histidine N(alpha)-methyltransferase [Chitinophagaceae bacterium]